MKKSKVTLLIFIIIFTILTFLGYPIIKSRYFNSNSSNSGSKIIKNENKSADETPADKNSESNPDANVTDESKNSVEDTKAPIITITSKDCDNDCSKFTKDNEKEYCQEICGTKTYFEDANDSGGDSSDCGDEKGIQKDYCLKDIAVGNKDFKICDEISDSEIKKACKNRISEDIIESQKN
ncbi:MAG: hypothetical protein Q7S18_02980 [bacterium]|nr:hypothetical protein [bacterium]